MVPMLAITAIMKNEGPYLKEWIDYHRQVGVGKFYLYDNGSSDDTHDVLAEYIANGLVEVIYYPGECKQVSAYNDSIKRHRFMCKYMAIIDCDEFLVASSNKLFSDIVDAIFSQNSRAGGIVLGWRIYGSAHYEKRPDGGVLKNFVYRSADGFEPNSLVKVIVDPRKVFRMLNPHHATYLFNYLPVSENGHYIGGGRRCLV